MRTPGLAPLLVFVCLGSLVSGCGKNSGSSSSSAHFGKTPAAAVALVQPGDIAHTLSLAGQFRPFQVIEVHAKVAGYIRHINVDIGDQVHAGETLATLEVPELSAQYRASQSRALQSQDTITAARHQVTRAKSLHTALQANYERLRQASAAEPGMIAAQELDNAQSQANASAAQVDAAEAALSGARQGALTTAADQERVGALRSYATISAPISGVVTWRYADTGALIQAGTSSDTQSLPVVKLAQLKVLRLMIPVPADAVRFVHIGDPMRIDVDSLQRSFIGKVTRFTHTLDPSTRTMQTEIDVPNPTLAITPGMYANAHLRLEQRHHVLTLPLTAVQGTGNTGVVFALNSENRIESRKVTLGLRGSFLVQVTGGLKSGDRVVLGDTSRYRPGERIVPRLQQEPTNDTMQQAGGVTDPENGGDQ